MMMYCSQIMLLFATCIYWVSSLLLFFFQAEDGIRDVVRSRGLGDVYKRQTLAGGPDDGGGGAA